MDSKKATDYNCSKCESKGRYRKADVFTDLNNMGIDVVTPLCYKCDKQWKSDMLELTIFYDNLLEE